MLLLLTTTVALACPSLPTATEHLASALIHGEATADAETMVTESLACAVARPADVAALYVVEGAARLVAGDTTAAAPWLAAARTLDPDDFDARMGPVVRAGWATAAAPVPASLRVDVPARIDGTFVSTWPLAAGAGPHLVQVVSKDGVVLYGQIVVLEPGAEASVPTALTEEELTARHPDAHPHHPVFLATAGAAAVLAGVGVAGSYWAEAAMPASETSTELETAHSVQVASAVTTYVLAPVAVISLPLYFVIR